MRGLDTYILADSQLHYQFDVRLPYSEPSGVFDGAAEPVWDVRTWHNIATGTVATRDYNYRTAFTPMDATVSVRNWPGFYLKPEVDIWLRTPNGYSTDQRVEDYMHVMINRERRGL